MAPTHPLALLLLVMPAASVLQFRAIAPLAIATLAATVVVGWRAERRVPWPCGAVLWAALALAGWGALSATWAVDPRRAAVEALLLGAFFILGAAAAGVIARAEPSEHRTLLKRLALGLAAGVVLAAVDHASGNAVRAAVRGLREWDVTLSFGLKPAITVFAVLLPLALAAPIIVWMRAVLALVAVAVALWLPAETAKIAILAGLAAYGLAWVLPRVTRAAIAGTLAIAILGMPVILGAVLARAPAGMLPFSAAHRVVIWDFAMGRIAERPLAGWGFEASRAIPGGKANAAPATLDRLGITDATQRMRFALPSAESLPLHPHNAPLQLHLELGLVGAALAALLAALLALRARHPGATGALAAAAVVGSLSYGLWQGWWIALLLVLVAASRALPAEGLEDIP
ncbi:MAG: O-antigen ligase family protein [Pseudomonadota bacterium]